MRFIRSLLLLIYFVLFTVPYATACFIAFPFLRADNRYWMAAGWCRATLSTVRWLNRIRYRIEGYENLPDGPAVLLSKHQSAWETLAFPALMPRPLCYVFKRELLYVPFFGWALGMLKMVHIDRKEGKYAFESVIKQGKARMAEGAWVIMFPEGTRTPVGSTRPYHAGIVAVYRQLGVPVVPGALTTCCREPVTALNRVDLPTLGLPPRATVACRVPGPVSPVPRRAASVATSDGSWQLIGRGPRPGRGPARP